MIEILLRPVLWPIAYLLARRAIIRRQQKQIALLTAANRWMLRDVAKLTRENYELRRRLGMEAATRLPQPSAN